MTTGQTTTSTDPRAMARAVVADLTGPGGQFELAVDDVLGTRLPVFTHRRRALHELLAESLTHGDRDYIVTATSRLTFARARCPGGVAGARRSVRTTASGPATGSRSPRPTPPSGSSPSGRPSRSARSPSATTPGGRSASWPTASRTRPRRWSWRTPSAPLLLEDCGVPVLSIETDVPRLCASYPDAPLPTCDVAEDDPAIILYTSRHLRPAQGCDPLAPQRALRRGVPPDERCAGRRVRRPRSTPATAPTCW